MKETGVCPKCGCNKISGPHKAGLIIQLMFLSATCKGWVCTKCGYAEFFSDDAGMLNIRDYEARKHRKKETKKEPRPQKNRECLFCKTTLKPDDIICPECGN